MGKKAGKKRSQSSVVEDGDITYTIGTRLTKLFYCPDDEASSTAWYPGKVSGHRYDDNGKVVNIVLYDDGDDEEMYDEAMQDTASVRLTVVAPITISSSSKTTSTPPNRNKTARRSHSDTPGTETEDATTTADPEDPVPVRSSSFASSSATQASSASTSSTSIDAPRNEPAPDRAPSSSSDRVISQVLKDTALDDKVKREGSAASLSEEERQKRKESLDKWVKANTDPRTKKGRFVFRRACHARCITKILGGSGMEPWPVVKAVPNGVDNPFVEPGEFYVAGDEDWNPFGPRFPGDYGFVNTEAFEGNPAQEEFHLFVQCSKNPHKRHWHGPGAKGGRMYVGVYKKVVDDDEIISSVSFQSTDLDHESKMTIAAFCVKRDYQEFHGCNLREGVTEEHFAMAKSAVGDTRWDGMDTVDKHKWAMLEYLTAINFKMDIAPVEFVRFDEALYQALVDIDAVISKKGQTGQVSLEATTLRQYFF